MDAIKPVETKDSRDFEKLVIWVSTFSIAVMAGILASIKQVNPAVEFRFSVISVIAFFAGGALTALFLRFVLNGNRQKRGLLVVAVAIACVLGYFLFGIKNVSLENRKDVTIGTAIALTALSFVAWLLWRVGRFFERDNPQKNPDEGGEETTETR
jgi:peptidoglycan/LPS O-acetylase OafA/YrhL